MSDVVATGILNIQAQVDNTQLLAALNASTAKITQQVSKLSDDMQSSFGKSFKNIGDASNKLSGTIGAGLSNAISATTRTMSNFAAIGGTALAGLVGRAIQLGTSFNELQNKTSNALTALTGSAKTASILLGQVNDVAAKSPFQTEIFLKATQQLTAFGTPLAKIAPLLQGISSAEAAVGGSSESIGSVVNALGRVEIQGRFTNRTLLAFQQQGIDAATIIGTQMGKTGDQIKTGILKGTIPAQVAIDALAKGLQVTFGNAADVFTNTLPGALEHFKKSLTDLGGKLSEAFVNPAGGGAAVSLFNSLADILQHITEIGGPLFQVLQQIGANITNAADKAKDFIDKINTAQVQQFVNLIKELAPALVLVSGALGGVGTKIAGQIPVIGGFVQEISPVAGAFLALAASTPAVRDAFIQVAQAISTALRPVLDDLAPALKTLQAAFGTIVASLGSSLASTITALAPSLDSLAKAFANLAVAVAPLAIDIAQGLGQTLVDLAPVISKVLDLFTGFINLVTDAASHLGPFSGIIKDIVEAFAGLVLAITAVRKAQELLTAVQAILTIDTGESAIAAGFLTVAFGLQAVATGAAAAATILLDGALAVLTSPITLIVGAVTLLGIAIFQAYKNFGPFHDIINDIGKFIADQLIATFNDLKDIITVITGIVGGIVDKFKELFDIITNLPGVKTIFHGIEDGIQGVADKLNLATTNAKGFKGIINDILGINVFKPNAPSPSAGAPPTPLANAPGIPGLEGGTPLINGTLNGTGGQQLPQSLTSINKSIQDQLNSVTDLTKSFDPLISATKAVTSANEALASAQKAVNDTTFQLTQANNSLKKLLEDTTANTREITDANIALLQTQNQLRDIEQQRAQLLHDLAEAQATEQEKLAKSARDQISASLDLQDAKRQEIILQRELNGFQTVSVNVAGLSLDQARIRLASVKASLQTQQDLSQGVNVGGQTQQQLQESFTRAQLSTADAQDKVTDSVRATADLQLSINNTIRDDKQKLADLDVQQTQANEKLIQDQLTINQLKEFGTSHDLAILQAKKSVSDLNVTLTNQETALARAKTDQLTATTNLRIQQDIINSDVAQQVRDTATLIGQKATGAGLDKASADSLKSQLDFITSATDKLDASRKSFITTISAPAVLGTLNASLEQVGNIKANPALANAFAPGALGTQLTQVLKSIQPIVIGLPGSSGQGLTDKNISDAVAQLLASPNSDLHQVLKSILDSLHLSLPGFAQGGLIESETIARIAEAGREVVLPLTRPARMADLLGMPQVLNPILAALPKISLPSGIESAQRAGSSPYGQGGAGSGNWEIERRKQNEELAAAIARAVVQSMQEAKMALGTVTINPEINPSKMMNEDDFVRKVSREVARYVRNELR